MVNRTQTDEHQERIEWIAWELYENLPFPVKRSSKNLVRDQAEEIANTRRQTMLFAINRLPARINNHVWKPLLHWANDQALISLLGLVGNVGVIIAVATYVGTEKQRRDAEVLNAWQTITSAYGQTGSGGRIQSLEFLNASPGANWRRKFPWVCAPHPLCTWKAEQLDGINLGAFPSDDLPPSDQTDENQAITYLQGIQLPRASLKEANLKRANLRSANLEGADLHAANLEGANLEDANLKGATLAFDVMTSMLNIEPHFQRRISANLEGAFLLEANLTGAFMVGTNLEGAFLLGTNLEEADLHAANLTGANLDFANLKGANLRGANLEGAFLENVNLEGADLHAANLEGASTVGCLAGCLLQDANLEGARNWTDELLTDFSLCRTTLPEGSTLAPNRDCEELGIDPATGERIEP